VSIPWFIHVCRAKEFVKVTSKNSDEGCGHRAVEENMSKRTRGSMTPQAVISITLLPLMKYTRCDNPHMQYAPCSFSIFTVKRVTKKLSHGGFPIFKCIHHLPSLVVE
jgi:hypothetical protein